MRRHCKKVSMFFFKFTITYFRFSTPETKDENIPWKNKQKYIQLKKLTAWKVLSCALTACDRDDGSVSTITWLLSRSVNRHSRLEPWINRQIRDSKKKYYSRISKFDYLRLVRTRITWCIFKVSRYAIGMTVMFANRRGGGRWCWRIFVIS